MSITYQGSSLKEIILAFDNMGIQYRCVRDIHLLTISNGGSNYTINVT